LLEITTTQAAALAPITLPASLPAPPPLPMNLATAQTVVLSDMGMGMGASGTGRFTINGKSFDPTRDDITMKAGVPEEWIVRNAGMMDHPLHIHGTSFQLVASTRANIASDPRLNAFMDTVNLISGEQIRIRLRIDTPGRRMFHCHILEHEAQGMMGVINIAA
jgi:bilirubin oxidase